MPRSKDNVDSSRLVTIGCGGIISKLYEPQSVEELSEVMRLPESGLQCIGFGSNLLIADLGIPTPVIKLGRGFRFVTYEGTSILRVGASYPLMQLSRLAGKGALSGLEFAAGIPGSVGGAVRMNAGAHHSEMSSVVRSVTVMLPCSKIVTIPAKELQFSYRHCVLPDQAIVIEVCLELTPGSQADIQKCTLDNLEYRKRTQPLSLPSCGSVFKNPVSAGSKVSAGALIESCGLKGTRIGEASISDLHANWIVNKERKASARDVLALIELCEATVKNQHGITLQREVQIWGSDTVS